MPISEEHLQELRTAKVQLEKSSFLMKAANAAGQPLERLTKMLPSQSRSAIDRATQASLDKGLDWAIATIGTTDVARSQEWLHRSVVTASGGLGGAFGWSALAMELPFSTIVMLRSIAAIARENGEDLRDAEARLQCLAVLSYGGTTKTDDAAETAYYAARTGLTTTLQRAAAQLTSAMSGGTAPRAARVVASFISQVAARFGIVVQQKAVAQSVPVVGALGGATLNNLFIGHFQAVSHGHFTVRRLERMYGEEVVREAYEELVV